MNIKKIPHKFKYILLSISIIVLAPIFAVLFFHFVFFQRTYPNTFVSDINLSGLDKNDAIQKISKEIKPLDKIVLTAKGHSFEFALSDYSYRLDVNASVENAFASSRTKSLINNLILPFSIIGKKESIPFVFEIDSNKLTEDIVKLNTEVAVAGVAPQVSYKNGKVDVEKGTVGEAIDIDKTLEDVKFLLSTQKAIDIPIVIVVIDNTLSQEQAVLAEKRAIYLLDKSLKFIIDNEEISYSQNQLLKLINPSGGYLENEIKFLANEIAQKFESNPQNPVFTFEEGKVKEFKPAKNGIKVNKDKLIEEIIRSLEVLETKDEKELSVNVPHDSSSPDYQTSDVNNLGIRELVGIGKSRFTGSIASRVHNISLASSHFNGVLVTPGETFSFNKILGDVSAATGYQQAYIIKEGATVLGDGGGVCQVSTTLFRAVLNAGLPITERRAHAYRVSYYELDSSPGLDATVYEPSPDLKFTNDTPGHLLIQTFVDTAAKTLRFEIYGTSDGRVSTITKPIITNVTPPPEDLYTDDPTLPTGTVKQIDWKAWGANVRFDYKVTRNQEQIYAKTFYSNYRPWQAKFLRGTGPAL